VGDLLPDIPSLGIPALQDQALLELQAVRTAAEAGAGDVAGAIESYRTELRTLTDSLHAILGTLEAGFSHPLLTPGAAFRGVEEELDRAIATRIEDFTDIEEKVEGIFVSIEEAVDAVDVSGVTGAISDAIED
jgi:hypothetical protein